MNADDLRAAVQLGLARTDQGADDRATLASGQAIRIRYTNWRGETAERMIEPIRIWWGNTEWHPESQWLMEAVDVEKHATRDFALRDMEFLK
jgi:predicted DNA-binding transcriptional regulator YafY